MLTITHLIALLTLLSIAYMDFRSRSVWLFLLLGLLMVNMIYVSIRSGLPKALVHFLINSMVVTLMVGFLAVYYRIGKRADVGFINRKLGAGDVVFWFCIAPVFSPVHFVLFLILSLLLVLMIVVLQWATTGKTGLVPLAGWQSLILFLVWCVCSFVLNYDLAADSNFAETLYGLSVF